MRKKWRRSWERMDELSICDANLIPSEREKGRKGGESFLDFHEVK